MREIRFYNTLTRSKEIFKPLSPPNVKMYVCGPTVYDFLHVGNFRGPVLFNLIRNFLEISGYKVTFAVNFTDIDDKIIKRASEQGITSLELSEKYIQEYKTDFKILGLRAHDFNPKVTDHLPAIFEMITELIKQGKAYVRNGDVWYSIATFKDYGKLSGQHTEDLIAGARVEVDESKDSPLDFALWKSVKPGEPSWDSPWGKGRPGWAIECSAMNKALFGDQIDIHGGGTDLMFPHHENEIAQTEGCTHKSFAQYWIHWQMLNLSGQKMSKSLGNIMSLRDFVSKYHPEIYKFMILSAHYRSTAELSDESIQRSVASLARIYSSLAVAESILKLQSESAAGGSDAGAGSQDSIGALETQWEKLLVSLSDDFNTPEMLAVVYEVIKNFNQSVKRGAKATPPIVEKCSQLLGFFKRLSLLSALFGEAPSDFLSYLDNMLIESYQIDKSKVIELVKQRELARKEKNFALSDQIRDQLTTMKISVSDLPTGSFWEVMK